MLSRDPDKKCLPESRLEYVVTGLLSPDGLFYECYWGEHSDLAGELGYYDSWDAVMHGWLRLAEEEFFDYTGNWQAKVPLPTKRQVEAIFDWVMAKEGRKMPAWIEELEKIR